MKAVAFGIAVLLLSFIGGIVALVALAALNPGVKGPHISDEQLTFAFFAGAGLTLCGSLLLIRWHRQKNAARAEAAGD